MMKTYTIGILRMACLLGCFYTLWVGSQTGYDIWNILTAVTLFGMAFFALET